MNSKIYFRLVSPILEPKTWTEGNNNYLLFRLRGKKDENSFLVFPPADAPLLIIPEDNSLIINQIKNRQKDDCFTTSFDNLKLKRDFLKGHMLDENELLSGLLIKDTNKLEKVKGTVPSFPEITFKVVKQWKEGYGQGNKRRPLTYQESFSQYGDYTHVLEIEPLELGIEGIPPITKIIFAFAEPTQPALWKALTKSKLYKSSILMETVGKTFTMRVKSWNLKAGLNTLTFHNDWDLEWDSFQEKTAENSNSPISPNQPKNNGNSTKPNGNKGLIIGATIIFVILVLTISFLWARKRKS